MSNNFYNNYKNEIDSFIDNSLLEDIGIGDHSSQSSINVSDHSSAQLLIK